MMGPELLFLVYLLTGVGALVLAVDVRQRRAVPGRISFCLLMLAIAEYAFAAGMEFVATDVATKVFWSQMEYVGVVSAPTLFLLFALAYTGQGRLVTPPVMLSLWIIPVVTILVAATNDCHFLLWSGFSMSPDGGNVLIYHHGVWFWMAVCWYALGTLLGSIILVRAGSRFQPVADRQNLLIALAAVALWAGIFIYLSGLSGGIDTSPMGFLVTGALIALGIERYQLFDVMPIAHDVLISSMKSGMLVVDTSQRITAANPAAGTLLGLDSAAIGKPLSLVLPEIARQIPEDLPESGCRCEVRTEAERAGRWLDMQISALSDPAGHALGHLVLLTDITDRKRAEEALYLANKKLHLLSSITRHDILNQIMALQGYLGFSKDFSREPALTEYLQRMETISGAIQRQIEFTREYEKLGSAEPGWHAVSAVADTAFRGEIALRDGCRELFVYADPMIEKVFSNLMDNAIRHGERVTEVGISFRTADDGATIVWEDNGVGVPDDQKESIFRPGVGKNTGFGLFLCKEILSITGIGITETGTYGHGARFEIAVPSGGWCLRE